MKSVTLIIDGNEFFFSNETKSYHSILSFLNKTGITEKITNNNFYLFQEHIKESIIQLTDEEKMKSNRRVLSRGKTIQYNGVTYDLNLSEDHHLHLYNLIEIDSTLENSLIKMILIKLNVL